MLENTAEIEPQSVALDFKNLSQYSNRSKWNCLLNLCRSYCNTNLLQSTTKLFGIAPKEPTTKGMIFTLTFHIFCNTLPKSWYFCILSFFFSSILLSPGTAKSIILQILSFLSTTTKSGPRASITWSVWILKSHQIL